MKRYMRKKLPNFEIHRVMSQTKTEGRVMMRQLREPHVIAGVPPECYVVDENAVLLPKRRRGEKFVVHYTVMEEAVL